MQFDKKLHAVIKQAALDRKTSMRNLFDVAIRAYLKKEGIKVPATGKDL